MCWQCHLWRFTKFQGEQLSQIHVCGDQNFLVICTITYDVYVPSFMKIRIVVSEELWRQFLWLTDGHTNMSPETYKCKYSLNVQVYSWRQSEKDLKFKGVIPIKMTRSKHYGNMHSNIWCPCYVSGLIKSDEYFQRSCADKFLGKYLQKLV